jgi:hypothetical protein
MPYAGTFGVNKYICHTLKVRHGIIRRLDGKKVTGYYSPSRVIW